jgi:NAD+ synthase
MPQNKQLNIALAQINPIVGALDFNRDLILRHWQQAESRVDLLVFPELCITGYPPEDLILKPDFIEHVRLSVEYIQEQSKNFAAAAIIGAPWEINGKTCNAALLIENGKITAKIAKNHLPNYGVFDEPRVFSAAKRPVPMPFRGFQLGVMICEDMWHDDVASQLQDMGADILIVINASPYQRDKADARMLHAQNRVKENEMPLLYVNQVGGQDELVFDGSSFVMQENGQVIFQGDSFAEGLYEIALHQNKGSIWFATTQDTGSSQDDNETLYRALVVGLRDYITKNGFNGILLGLSGGIDSALSAAIAVDALGPELVRGVFMPSAYTSKESREDAVELAQNLGIHMDEISIEAPLAAFNDLLAPHFTSATPETTFENMQPRIRGQILMALSNASGYMVLATGNKSEIAVGYSTLYGDMCGGFNVLKDVYKTKVYKLSNWRNANKPLDGLGAEGAVIPERSITRAPTAELKPNQTDQDTLPPYDALDAILFGLIEEDMGLDDLISRGHDRETVLKVWKMLDRAEHKRRQAPPGIKISQRSFGRGRRYPITNHFVNLIDK